MTTLQNYTKGQCSCSEWVEARGNSLKATQLETLLSYYPGVCPYCREKLATRPLKVGVYIAVESGVSGYFVPLAEFKELLERENLRDGFDDRVDNLSTDLWGGAGPDCRTQPALSRRNNE